MEKRNLFQVTLKKYSFAPLPGHQNGPSLIHIDTHKRRVKIKYNYNKTKADFLHGFIDVRKGDVMTFYEVY